MQDLCGPLSTDWRDRMRGDPGLDIARCAESGLVECVETLSDYAGCVGGIDLSRIPVFLWRRILLVGIGSDQTGIDDPALTADQTFRDAPRDGRLEQVAQKFAVAKTPMPVLGKR